MRTSTNALTARWCAKHGIPCETVQSWRGRQRHDCFGIADSLLLTSSHAILVQNASYGSLKPHRDAIEAHPNLAPILRAGFLVEIWEWRRPKLKRGGTNKSRLWQLRRQHRNMNGWGELEEWSEPMDLYPRPAKP